MRQYSHANAYFLDWLGIYDRWSNTSVSANRVLPMEKIKVPIYHAYFYIKWDKKLHKSPFLPIFWKINTSSRFLSGNCSEKFFLSAFSRKKRPRKKFAFSFFSKNFLGNISFLIFSRKVAPNKISLRFFSLKIVHRNIFLNFPRQIALTKFILDFPPIEIAPKRIFFSFSSEKFTRKFFFY